MYVRLEGDREMNEKKEEKRERKAHISSSCAGAQLSCFVQTAYM